MENIRCVPPQNTVKQDFFARKQIVKNGKKNSFEEFVSDPKNLFLPQDILQGFTQENT
jgi:hypothetical protein